jgi:hypothetical protein
MSRIFIINVGVNASHDTLRSPLFDDRSFEFIPIPEKSKSRHKCPDCELLPRYLDLKPFGNHNLLEIIPKRYHNLRVHNDPEFDTFTYGDYPTLSPRAANLKNIKIGDYLFFLARLVRWRNGRFTDEAGFYFIGFFEIKDILKNVTSEPSKDQLRIFGNNAHIRRGLYSSEFWDGFWVFRGSKNSKRFKYAIPFTKEFANTILDDLKRGKIIWPSNRSELQVIGSYTRACRIIREEKNDIFWKFIDENSFR